jgi:hypothetical protein
MQTPLRASPGHVSSGVLRYINQIHAAFSSKQQEMATYYLYAVL